MQYREADYPEETWEVYWFEKNLQGDIIAVYDEEGTLLLSYTYTDAWGNYQTTHHNHASTTAASLNPFKYRGYYYDSHMRMYLLGTRYYDPILTRFISPDKTAVLTATPDALTDKNLYAYCDNNPVMRVDCDGEFWIFANAFVGGIIGAISKVTENLVLGNDLLDGVIGAAVGGAVGGVISATTGNLVLASYASAATEAIVNEVFSYTSMPSVNGEPEAKSLTVENITHSVSNVLEATAVNGTINAITGKLASRIMPTNNGWFKPKKLISSFVGKYARKAHGQSFIQELASFTVNLVKENK